MVDEGIALTMCGIGKRNIMENCLRNTEISVGIEIEIEIEIEKNETCRPKFEDFRMSCMCTLLPSSSEKAFSTRYCSLAQYDKKAARISHPAIELSVLGRILSTCPETEG